MRFTIALLALFTSLAPVRAEFLVTSPSEDAAEPHAPAPQVRPTPVKPKFNAPKAHRPPSDLVLVGFGNHVPLSFAARQIVPAGFQVGFGDTVDRDSAVDWKGGRPWRATLSDAVRPLGLAVLVDGSVVTIEAPSPAALTSFIFSRLVRAGSPQRSPSASRRRFLTDPAAFENWIDAPRRAAPVLFSSPSGAPDEIDKALDALADAIGRTAEGEHRSVAFYLHRAPIAPRTRKALSQLTSSRLAAFLKRHASPDQTVTTALMPSLVASGAADRLARAQVFRRLTTPSRLYALQRAGDAAALQRKETRP